ncbi:hypothetical protein AAFF_G00333770 [Aldrovandia affinis]|uniref:Ig-like domain-containing protein n=1 Tax=Aldrovandia affinis TaxID=143900 RepID=A0AAD7R6M9_9TELE|nr:hypothetical protein AAFF_G00333770 [Aldrovandia affinis]
MMLHCLFLMFSTMLGQSISDTITPTTNAVHALEGSSLMLSCNYTGSARSLQWYRQFPRSKPEFLILIMESTNHITKAVPPHPRLSVKLDKENKRVDLEISSAEVTDSALYYCALEPTVTGNPILCTRT